MTFVLARDLPLDSALRAAALGELDAALSRLGTPPLDDPAVHDVRKHIKKLRAWLRLLQRSLGPEAKIHDRTLRDAARGLSSHRDFAVAQKTLLELCRGARLGQSQTQRLMDMLGDGSAPPVAGARVPVDARLREVRDALAGRPLDISPGQLRKALERSRMRCRRGLKRAAAHLRVDDLHHWRKQVKYYGYQCALLASRHEQLRQAGGQLRGLGETLGHHHDLHVLLERLEAAPSKVRDAELLKLRIRELAVARMDRLSEQALRRGKRLFAPPS